MVLRVYGNFVTWLTLNNNQAVFAGEKPHNLYLWPNVGGGGVGEEGRGFLEPFQTWTDLWLLCQWTISWKQYIFEIFRHY